MLKVNYLAENTSGRDYVVGDLHGCVDLLKRFIEVSRFDPSKDRVLSVGDLVGRGPKPLETFDLIKQPWFHCVRGNHEMMLALYHERLLPVSALERNGEGWFLRLGADIRAEIAAKVMGLPDVLVVGREGKRRFNVFHAEFIGCDDDLERGLEQFDQDGWERVHWGRDLIKEARFAHSQGNFTNVPQEGLWAEVDLSLSFVGHTIVGRPVVIKNVVYMDTGAYRSYRPVGKVGGAAVPGDGALTICRADTMDFWQVHADGKIVRLAKSGKTGRPAPSAEYAYS